MKSRYQFSLLRYVYDPLTEEFINVGVVLYSSDTRFLHAIFSNRYGRISKMFRRIDGAAYRTTLAHIEQKLTAAGQDIERGLLFSDSQGGLDKILSKILPPDDSAMRFVFGGVGVTEDTRKTLESLFERYVARYEHPTEFVHRDENDVWRVFQTPLKAKRVYSKLVTKTITAPNYEYQFERSWRNGVWHMLEPVSFDLSDERSILEKASRWVGRTTSLSDSAEPFKLFLLLGEPANPNLREAFHKATNLLAKIPGEKELIREREAEQFADTIEQEFENHELETTG